MIRRIMAAAALVSLVGLGNACIGASRTAGPPGPELAGDVPAVQE